MPSKPRNLSASTSPLRVAVIGAGAMGSLFGARLAARQDVVLLDRWEDHVEAINAHGLTLVHPDGESETVAVPATTDVADIPDADLAIIFVKSHETEWAARQAEQCLRSDGLALTLQNGLGNAAVLARILGETRTVQGVTAHGATLTGPGSVRHAGAGPTHLAEVPDAARSVQEVAEALTAAGLETTVSEDVQSLVWGKLVINAGINALTALLRVPNGQLIAVPAARVLLEAAVREAAAVARAKGIDLPYPDPIARTTEVASATGTNRSSMLADVLRGAATEVEVINGAVVREGEQVGVATPVNAVLYRLVKALDETVAVRVSPSNP
jgi:2-dehydropantoate 2-reductase